MRDRALELLRRAVGNPRAQFRPGQWEAIQALVEGRERLLVVERTGWGKSIVFAFSNGGLAVYALAPPRTPVQLTGTRTGQTTVATNRGATGIAYIENSEALVDVSGSGSNTSSDIISFTGTSGAQFSCNGQMYSYVTTIDLSAYIAINNCPGDPGQTCGTATATNTINISGQ